MKTDQELVHLANVPFVAVCGADQPNQRTSMIREHVTCPKCLDESVKFCPFCGSGEITFRRDVPRCGSCRRTFSVHYYRTMRKAPAR